MTSKTTKATPKVVRTRYTGTLLSLASEGAREGSDSGVRLSPGLDAALRHWAENQPMDPMEDLDSPAVKKSLVAELMRDFGLDKEWADIFAQNRLEFESMRRYAQARASQ